MTPKHSITLVSHTEGAERKRAETAESQLAAALAALRELRSAARTFRGGVGLGHPLSAAHDHRQEGLRLALAESTRILAEHEPATPPAYHAAESASDQTKATVERKNRREAPDAVGPDGFGPTDWYPVRRLWPREPGQ